MLYSKKYYIAIEYYDKDGNSTKRLFVNERAFGCMYSFVCDVNNARFFGSLKDARDFVKNLVVPVRSKVFFEEMFDCV